MTLERYQEVNFVGKGLTKEEVKEGWHFCSEWDQLLVGPGMPEKDACICFSNKCPTCEE